MPDKQTARPLHFRAAKQSVSGYKYAPYDKPDPSTESAAEASTSARSLSSRPPPHGRRPRKPKTVEEKFDSVTLDTYRPNTVGERQPRERRCITTKYDADLPCAFPGCDWCEWSCWKIWKPKEERFHPLPNGAILSEGPNKGERQYWYAFFGEDGPKTIEWDGTMVSRGLRPTDCPESGYKRTAPGFAPESVHRDDAPSRAPDSDDELFMLSPHSFDLPPLHRGVELIFEAEHGDEEEEELFRLSFGSHEKLSRASQPHNFVLLPYADAQRDNGVGPVEPADDAYDADVELFRLRPIVLGPVDAV
ncbi:hypothetical protein Rhopal_002599-T1 [Rhodotorula paludigena]|uniref:Uncharacterized protein n=1 Tax=Rhodotorula paludigena TaxID=86838 RepID=A0AAV5GJI4_9BASI|nr:hypothetical protein Rhopal_002599-T1 [Rhodotorula paludigena]